MTVEWLCTSKKTWYDKVLGEVHLEKAILVTMPTDTSSLMVMCIAHRPFNLSECHTSLVLVLLGTTDLIQP